MAPDSPIPLPPDLQELLSLLQSSSASLGNASVLRVMAALRSRAHNTLPAAAPLRRMMDSEDLVQDTVLHLISAVEDFRGRTWPEFMAFANTVLQQKTAQHGRRAQVRAAELSPAVDDSDAILPGPGGSPSVHAATAEERKRLHCLIDKLPNDYREVLRLRLEGHDGAVLAARLGIRADAARQRLSRALALLREKW